MRAGVLAFFACLAMPGQVIPRLGPGAAWRGSLGGLLGRQPSQVTYDDLSRFEGYLVGAGPYCSALTPADYAANRLMMHSMAAYVATMNAYTRDPRMRDSLGRLRTRISAFPCAWAGYQPEPLEFEPIPPPVNVEPPFAMEPPRVENVASADQETYSDLRARYVADATRAASVWRSAAAMNARLSLQRASLNADTAAAVSRFQLLLGLAAGSMLDRRWEEVLDHLRALEAETAKVSKVVGR